MASDYEIESLIADADELDERVKELDAELRDLRTALAASQAREAMLRQALRSIDEHSYQLGHPEDRTEMIDSGRLASCLSALADPSPASDALGRVVRASVAECQQARRWQEWGDNRSLPITADQEKKWLAFLLENGELGVKRRDAVDELLAVAPHWGEPRGGGR